MTQKNEKNEKSEISHIATIGGSLRDLSFIDFSMLGLKIYHINDPKLLDYFSEVSIDDFAQRNHDFVVTNSKHDNDNLYIDSEYLNILVPISINRSPELNIYFDAVNALRLIHPSELAIRNVFHSQIESEKIYIGSFATFEHNRIGDYKDLYKYYFTYPEKYISSTNKFLKIYFERINNLLYVKNALKYYNGAFQLNDKEMAFVSLCICLESIVPSAEQLSFRFRRNLAVLCGEDDVCSRVIYNNAKLLYSYRSKLVHFGMKSSDYRKFDNYFEYALLITSRMLIEMIIHNQPNIETLDEKLNQIGFGERKKISLDYVSFDGNARTEIGILSDELK